MSLRWNERVSSLAGCAVRARINWRGGRAVMVGEGNSLRFDSIRSADQRDAVHTAITRRDELLRKGEREEGGWSDADATADAHLAHSLPLSADVDFPHHAALRAPLTSSCIRIALQATCRRPLLRRASQWTRLRPAASSVACHCARPSVCSLRRSSPASRRSSMHCTCPCRRKRRHTTTKPLVHRARRDDPRPNCDDSDRGR